ncbi:outer membrane beta-barrel protein [bacterium]|nr:outer membrane beta-barrel protein [bacterium]
MRKVVLILLAVCLMAGMATAQTEIGFNGIGGYLGYAIPEGDVSNTLAFGARADLGTIINPNIRFAADLMYWSTGEDLGAFEWSWSQFYITALALYDFGDASASIIPYAGGGLGFVFSSWDTKWTGSDTMFKPGVQAGTSTYSDNGLAIHLLGGVRKAFGDNLMGFAEASYILGGFDTLVIRAGAVYSMK